MFYTEQEDGGVLSPTLTVDEMIDNIFGIKRPEPPPFKEPEERYAES